MPWSPAATSLMPPGIPPTLVVDLISAEGAAALGVQWRVSDVTIDRLLSITVAVLL